jgi:aspartoacylase
MIKQVAMVGGTHGNEFTGIYLLKKWQQHSDLIKRQSFTTSTVFANPRAYEHNCRYIDGDLNRRFTRAELDDETLADYEQSRAKVLNQQLGPKGAQQPNCDLIIDLHTTTSNMGPTLILPTKSQFYNQMAAYVLSQMPEVTVFCHDDKILEQHYLLCTIARYGVIIEVGPVPQAVLRHDVFSQTEQLSHIILDFIEHHNNNTLPDLPDKVSAYRFTQSIKQPLDSNGERIGIIHPNIQDNDFKAIHPGDPLFITFTGEDILYQGKEVVYPAFVNEAAYYDDNLAMSLMSKVELIV